MLPYLLAGAVFFSFFARPRSAKKGTSSQSIPGITFKCSSIKLTDKTKFHSYLKNKINQNFPDIDLYNADFIQIFLKLFQQINKNCYSKFIKQQLSSTEKITILILFSEITDSLREFLMQEVPDNNIFDQKLVAFTDYISMWMNASKELDDLPSILQVFQTTYKYP